MNIHKNARLMPRRREEMALSVIEGRPSRVSAALAYGVCVKVVTRWTARYKTEGRAGMADRSSRPVCSPKATDRAVVERIVTLRRQRWTGRHIAQKADVEPGSDADATPIAEPGKTPPDPNARRD